MSVIFMTSEAPIFRVIKEARTIEEVWPGIVIEQNRANYGPQSKKFTSLQ